MASRDSESSDIHRDHRPQVCGRRAMGLCDAAAAVGLDITSTVTSSRSQTSATHGICVCMFFCFQRCLINPKSPTSSSSAYPGVGLWGSSSSRGPQTSLLFSILCEPKGSIVANGEALIYSYPPHPSPHRLTDGEGAWVFFCHSLKSFHCISGKSSKSQADSRQYYACDTCDFFQ